MTSSGEVNGDRVDCLLGLLHGLWLGRVFAGGNLENLVAPGLGDLPGLLTVMV